MGMRVNMLALAGIAVSAVPAQAQDVEAEDGSQERASDSGGQVTIYGWLAGATGDFTPFAGAPTVSFDNSFGDVLEDLDAAFFASGQFRKDRLVVVADVSYASLSRDGLVPPGIPASGKVSQLAITALAGMRVEDGDDLKVDVLAGARLWNLDGRVEVPLAGVSIAPDRTFVDPVVAVRVNAGLAPRLSAIVHTDIGGFGVGSDFTYQFVATVNYQLGRSTWVSAGWRHLHLDYNDAGTAFEGSQTGPLFGVTQRF
jgi:hypothetical protein